MEAEIRVTARRLIRDDHREGRPLSHPALNFDATTVPLDDLFTDGKAQPRPDGIVLGATHAEEFCEQVGQGIFRNAQACVGHT